MPIPIACPSCRASYTLPDDLAGRQVRCRDCKEVLRVPGTKVPKEQRVTGTASAAPSPQVGSTVGKSAPTVRLKTSSSTSSRAAKIDSKPVPPKAIEDEDDFNFDELDFGNADENGDDAATSIGHACRRCGEPIARRAKECPHCGTVFDTGLKKKKAKSKKNQAKKTKKNNKQVGVRGECPRTIIVIACLNFLAAFALLLGSAYVITLGNNLGPGPVFLIGLVGLYFGGLAFVNGIGLWRGHFHFWWAAVANHTTAMAGGLLNAGVSLATGQPVQLVVGPLFGVGINYLFMNYYRSEEVKTYFQIGDAGVGRR